MYAAYTADMKTRKTPPVIWEAFLINITFYKGVHHGRSLHHARSAHLVPQGTHHSKKSLLSTDKRDFFVAKDYLNGAESR